MSDMRSLATLDLLTTRYGDFHVPILFEKLPYYRLACTNRQCENSRVKKVKLMPQTEDKSQSARKVKWE